jgi:hypothetical protein
MLNQLVIRTRSVVPRIATIRTMSSTADIHKSKLQIAETDKDIAKILKETSEILDTDTSMQLKVLNSLERIASHGNMIVVIPSNALDPSNIQDLIPAIAKTVGLETLVPLISKTVSNSNFSSLSPSISKVLGSTIKSQKLN